MALLLLAWLGPLVAAQRPVRLVDSTIRGIFVGGVYGLIALGIVVINKSSGVFNFAHGWMMLLGGMIFYTFFTAVEISPLAAFVLSLLTVVAMISAPGWSALRVPRNWLIGAAVTVVLTLLMVVGGSDWKWVHAIVGAIVGAILMGLVIERFTIRPLIGQPLFAAVMMTLAVGEVLQGFTQLVWGSVQLGLPIFSTPNAFGMMSRIPNIQLEETVPGLAQVLGGNVTIDTASLIAFGLALAAFALFVAFFQFTSVGLAMRATAENQQLAQSVGLRVRSILAVAWAIAALLAGIAGVLQGGATSLSVTLPFLALRAFPAVLLGGLESIGGALIGGLVVGLVEQWATLLFPGTQAGEQLAPYLVLMAVLVIRPEGLFGQKRIERI